LGMHAYLNDHTATPTTTDDESIRVDHGTYRWEDDFEDETLESGPEWLDDIYTMMTSVDEDYRKAMGEAEDAYWDSVDEVLGECDRIAAEFSRKFAVEDDYHQNVEVCTAQEEYEDNSIDESFWCLDELSESGGMVEEDTCDKEYDFEDDETDEEVDYEYDEDDVVYDYEDSDETYGSEESEYEIEDYEYDEEDYCYDDDDEW